MAKQWLTLWGGRSSWPHNAKVIWKCSTQKPCKSCYFMIHYDTIRQETHILLQWMSICFGQHGLRLTRSTKARWWASEVAGLLCPTGAKLHTEGSGSVWSTGAAKNMNKTWCKPAFPSLRETESCTSMRGVRFPCESLDQGNWHQHGRPQADSTPQNSKTTKIGVYLLGLHAESQRSHVHCLNLLQDMPNFGWMVKH